MLKCWLPVLTHHLRPEVGESSGRRGLSSTGHAVLVLQHSSMAQPAWGRAGSHRRAWQLQLLAGSWPTLPALRVWWCYCENNFSLYSWKVTLPLPGSYCFVYHVRICKEGQKLDRSQLIEKNPPRPISNPGLLLKLLTRDTEKEAELPNLSSPPIQLAEKMWKIYAIAAGEGWTGIYK